LRFPGELLLGSLRVVRLHWAERLSRPRLAGALRAAVLGRTWIALVAFALIGIVTLQLGLLKLNASIGRGLEHEALLQGQNAELSIENSEMDASASIQSRAGRLGMELVAPGSLRFLSARPGADTNSAAAALNAPIGSSASGSPEASASAPQGQSGASAASAGTTSPAGTETASTPGATAPSSTGSQGAPASEPGASSTASSPPATTTAPEAARATPSEPAAAPSPAGGSSAGAPAAGGSGEPPSGGGTQTAGPGG
jgi:hypothetical protein